MLDISKTHWVVIKGSHFSGSEWVAERRKTRSGAFNAMRSLMNFYDSEHWYFYVIRNDVPNEKWY